MTPGDQRPDYTARSTGVLVRPAGVLASMPGQAGLYGVLAAIAFIFLPLASALLVAAMILFWGWFPGIVLVLFLAGTFALLWILSPLITGLWLGQRLSSAFDRPPDYLPAVLLGVLLLPCSRAFRFWAGSSR